MGDLGLITGLGGSPTGGHGSPRQYSCLENPHGQRSLLGTVHWFHKELDMTERLSTHTHKVAGLESCEVASLVLLCWSLGDKCNF